MKHISDGERMKTNDCPRIRYKFSINGVHGVCDYGSRDEFVDYHNFCEKIADRLDKNCELRIESIVFGEDSEIIWY